MVIDIMNHFRYEFTIKGIILTTVLFILYLTLSKIQNYRTANEHIPKSLYLYIYGMLLIVVSTILNIFIQAINIILEYDVT